jgi:hypothetical protein
LEQIKDLDDRADEAGIDAEEWALSYHLEDQIMAIYRQEDEY